MVSPVRWSGVWFFAVMCLSPVLHAVASWPPEGQAVRADVTRDAWISSAGQEMNGNNGGATRLKTKGVQEFFLLDLDPKILTGRVITGATLHLHSASKDFQRRLTISSLASDWVEGTGTSYNAEKGSVCFNWAALGKQRWTRFGGDITAVCNGLGNTIWRFAEAIPPNQNGWQEVAVEPAVLAARIAGISYGFVVMDDVGSEYERQGEKFTYHLFPNRFVHSREQNRSQAPYFTVYLGAEDRESPGAVQKIAVMPTDIPGGEIMVTWTTPADVGPAGTIGFLVRVGESRESGWNAATPVPQYLVPMAAAPGKPVIMHLRDLELPPTATVSIRAVDRAGNVGPISQIQVKVPPKQTPMDLAKMPVQPFATAGARPAVAGVDVAVIDTLDKMHPVTGTLIPAHPEKYLQANHLWSAATKTIRLHAARNEFVDFQIVLSGQSQGITAELAFDDAGPAAPKGQLYRFRHVKTKAGPLPDPLLPLTGPVTIPAGDEAIAGQNHASVIADVYVPHNAQPGLHTGTLTLRSGAQSLAIRVELNVWNFVLPDYLSFIPEMNCYGLPNPPNDLAYYRLAHVHRTCLNRLGYNWRGQVDPHAAPRWTGQDFDWTDWDRHYGPILDGSAFADLPRSSVPVDALYLQLNENWPLDINKAFKGGYWADEAIDPAYRKTFIEACGKMAAHISGKQWQDTFFEFYLNNKVYFKQDAWSKSSAPWILDEPHNTQDFWALRYYGTAFHEGIAPHRGRAKLVFRCDISRPEWQRDILDGVLDVNIIGGAFRRYHRAVMDRKVHNGEITINYGSANAIEQSNVQPATWCIESWVLGADGVLPWQTVGENKSWSEGDQLSLFYPGKPVGSEQPVPSIRLKAFRRGQQDVEYLMMLSQLPGCDRQMVSEAIRGALKLAPVFRQSYAEDAGFIDYGNVDPAALWAMRLRVGAMLDAAKPRDKRRLIELRTPPRDVSKLPDIGYVTVAPPRERE